MRPELTQAAELLRRNTPEAVEQAILLLQHTVYSFSMKVCGHPEDAEDTMQEVLFRSLPHLAKIQNPNALAAWLYTVTRNRCWRMRRNPAGAPRQTVALDDLMPDDAELGRLLADTAENPESHLLQEERSHLLHRAVLRLPPALRLVLVLHDMEELDTGQVATIMGLKPGTVRVRLHRARLVLHREMTETVGAGDPNPPGTSRKTGRTVARRPTECRELFLRLSEYLDGRVPSPQCDEMRKHIESCPACVAFLREVRAAIDRCRSLEIPCDAAVAPRLRSMLTDEYLRMIDTESEDRRSRRVTKRARQGFHPVKGVH